MYKLCFYVPTTHVETVKNALFAKGAGRIGDYAACCWQVLGEGQFMPLESSTPFIGEVEKISKVAEYQVEMVCTADCMEAVIAELKRVHPYEEPAYQYWQIMS
jgi:hypothetical protein